MTIHPSAIIEDGATLGDDVEIGPFCHIGPQVTLGTGARLRSHVVISGNTTIGVNANIYPFASLGHAPQHLKYKGEDTRLIIGDNCLIRESVTMNPGTVQGHSETKIGNDCAFLTGAHVAHDCVVGDRVTLINNVMLAGHCVVGDFATIAGGSGIHQFTRIGHHAYIGGMAAVEGDVIPFGMVLGNRAYLSGLNVIGMKRAGFNRDAVRNVRKAYRMLFSDDLTFRENMDEVQSEYPEDPLVQDLLGFIRSGGDRAICFPRHSRPA
ncbi:MULTISPECIES: acyl-ACP--UDP-N-acetylglucosamine O-acyltransferase [unclassified Aureimonas]|uniref:acyl-ACP--UDP-N-acetylglucosamine O-acyltransferase n=1 Tax=unclassified Aureimonas TaxID=2615206 RepID=UPI0007008F0A|nr:MULTISPECIES: acyl-ACP--UDP-N-acetylglucosamine O-acyltransferase [unclassified Aureimonas]KQT60319.1 UDP-N-acetylglucosamine O-acyltransferase [Aureimonas sp. Leaf427]KQT79195.1 UDP-N-acetylglucosamine O-acyltransferase [Aureimonas sp. Leaf460]